MSGVEELLAPERLAGFVLVLARVAGLFLLAPVFGSRMVSLRVRAAIALFVAVAMLPLAHRTSSATPLAGGSALELLLAIGAETAIGLLLGLLATLVFGAVLMAGELAGMQMGLGLVGLIDPQSHDRAVPLAQWQNTLALLLFLAIDGHHALLQAVARSFDRVPVGGASLGTAALGMALGFAGEVFVLALQIAAPVLVLVLMVNAGLGALAKLIPQLNVMVVGFPVNVAAGFFMLAAAQPFTLRLFEASFARAGAMMGGVIDALG